MKLIFCPLCEDVVKIRTEQDRKCWCGRSGGRYLPDGLNAFVFGSAIPIGFNNKSFRRAIKDKPKEGSGHEFTAFVIPDFCKTIDRK